MVLKTYPITQPVIWTALGVSLSLLAGAHAFEYFGGLAPCALCLTQRTAHWVVVGIASAGIVVIRRSSDIGPLILAALALAFLASTGIAGYHAGVEYGWWAGPASCTRGLRDSGTAQDLLAALQKPAEMPACDKIPWTLLGISMAGYNALISFDMTLLCAFALVSPRVSLRERN